MMNEAAIVGGGLAGLSAAITLAQAGARVTLFEAKTYPYHRVCGEYLSPECGHVLAALGVGETIRALAPPAMHTAAITTPDGTTWEGVLPPGGIGLSRYALDDLLADRARALGVEVCQGTTITAIDGNLASGYTLRARRPAGGADHAARVVLCAHGKRGALDRALSRPFLKTPQPYIGLKAHYDGPPLPGRVELHTFDGGYCGLSHIEGGRTNLCLLARTEAFQANGTDGIDGFIAWIASQNAHMRCWLDQAVRVTEWSSIHQVPFVFKERAIREMLMVGDAAGLIAPLAGDGMGMALQGGQMAAAHTLDYLTGRVSSEAFAPGYAAAWGTRFASRLRLGRFLQACLLRPRLASGGLRVLNTLPALGRYFVTHTRDEDAQRAPEAAPLQSHPQT